MSHNNHNYPYGNHGYYPTEPQMDDGTYSHSHHTSTSSSTNNHNHNTPTNNTTDIPKTSLASGVAAGSMAAAGSSKHAKAAAVLNGTSFIWMSLSHQPIAKELAIFIQTAETLQKLYGSRLQHWHVQLLRKAWATHNNHCQNYWTSLDKILKSYLGKHMEIPPEMTADRDDVLYYCALITSLLEEDGRLDILDELMRLLHDHRNTLKTVCNAHKERFIPLFQAFCTPEDMVTMVQKTLSTNVKACDGAWMYHHGIENLLRQIFQNQDSRNAYSWINVFENLSQSYERTYVEPLRALKENLQPFCVFD